jgi:4-alpha-glucanotransferase
MNAADLERLQMLARVHGVQTSCLDTNGQRQTASPEVLAAVLDALGVPAGNARKIRDSLAYSRRQRPDPEPVVVAWNKRPATVELILPTGKVRQPIRCRLQLENGAQRDLSHAVTRAPGTTPTGSIKRFALPVLPFGYHRLETEIGNRRYQTLVISAPTKSYSKPGLRAWGAFLPMYAAHSRQSWGAGNFSDWQRLCEWIGSAGGKIASTLPLLAAFLDYPTCDPSPYAPASRLFWNEFYIDITAVPEFSECPAAQKLAGSTAFQHQLDAFRRDQMIDYRAQWAARRKVLAALARSPLKPARRSAFEKFLQERPDARDYARFRAVCDQTKMPWQDWPRRLREGTLRSIDCDENVERSHLYVQWIAQEQIDRLIARCRASGVKLYLDLPLGVHPAGYDAWRERESFAHSSSVGAPPDVFFTKGQNWGFAPLHPQRIRKDGYRHVLDYLRFQMRHTGLLRIDHVMGFHRLYWVPQGFPAAQGAYVSYRAEELHAIFNLESHRQHTTLVGENLGTVPPEVNESMARHRLREMFVAQYEQRPDPQAALREPPVRSVAGINTHDMPTFAAHWQGDDILDRNQLGLIPDRDVAKELAKRKKLKTALVKFLAGRGWLKAKRNERAVLKALLAWLAASPAEIVLINLEDLLLEKLPQNTPGTCQERPNWKRKAKLTLEQIFQNRSVRTTLNSLNQRRGTKL